MNRTTTIIPSYSIKYIKSILQQQASLERHRAVRKVLLRITVYNDYTHRIAWSLYKNLYSSQHSQKRLEYTNKLIKVLKYEQKTVIHDTHSIEKDMIRKNITTKQDMLKMAEESLQSLLCPLKSILCIWIPDFFSDIILAKHKTFIVNNIPALICSWCHKNNYTIDFKQSADATFVITLPDKKAIPKTCHLAMAFQRHTHLQNTLKELQYDYKNDRVLATNVQFDLSSPTFYDDLKFFHYELKPCRLKPGAVKLENNTTFEKCRNAMNSKLPSLLGAVKMKMKMQMKKKMKIKNRMKHY